MGCCTESGKQNGCMGAGWPPHDYVAGRGLRVAGTVASHRRRVSFHITLTREEIQIENLGVWFLQNEYSFHTTVKEKNSHVEPS